MGRPKSMGHLRPATARGAEDGRARHQQARRHRRPLHQLERLHQDPLETVTDVQEEEEEEMTCVEMIDATTGPARHLITHQLIKERNATILRSMITVQHQFVKIRTTYC